MTISISDVIMERIVAFVASNLIQKMITFSTFKTLATRKKKFSTAQIVAISVSSNKVLPSTCKFTAVRILSLFLTPKKMLTRKDTLPKDSSLIKSSKKENYQILDVKSAT